MKKFKLVCALATLLFTFFVSGYSQAASAKIIIVAAENFYGDISRQIGGDLVDVSSILSNPDQDPHLFEASPSVARAMSQAKIVVLNGLNYDSWAQDLLTASLSKGRAVIVAGDIAGKVSGDNPHIWYDIETMRKVALSISKKLTEIDPANAKIYQQNASDFEQSLFPISQKIAAISASHKGLAAAATEPVFGYMFQSLGFDVKEMQFQISTMNDTEPSISDVAQFEKDLENRVIKVLVYNGQATSPLADRMLALAKKQSIPVVAVSETEPAGKNYQQWMLEQVNAISVAIGN